MILASDCRHHTPHIYGLCFKLWKKVAWANQGLEKQATPRNILAAFDLHQHSNIQLILMSIRSAYISHWATINTRKPIETLPHKRFLVIEKFLILQDDHSNSITIDGKTAKSHHENNFREHFPLAKQKSNYEFTFQDGGNVPFSNTT